MRWAGHTTVYLMAVAIGLCGSQKICAGGAIASAVKTAGKAGGQVAKAVTKAAPKLGRAVVSTARVGSRAGRSIAKGASRFGVRLFSKVDDAARGIKGVSRQFNKFVSSKLKFSGKAGRGMLENVGAKWNMFEMMVGVHGMVTGTESAVDYAETEQYEATGILGEALEGAKPIGQRAMPAAGSVIETQEVGSTEEISAPVPATEAGVSAAEVVVPSVEQEAPAPAGLVSAFQMATVTAVPVADLPAVPELFGAGMVYDPNQGGKVLDAQTGEDTGGFFVNGQILSPERTHLFVPHADAMVAIPQDTEPVPDYPGYVYDPAGNGEIYDPQTGEFTKKEFRNGVIMSLDGTQIYDP